MSGLSLTVWDSPGGAKLADLSGRIDAGVMRHGEHGPLECAVHIPMRHDEAAQWLSMLKVGHLVLSEDGRPIWSGRVEDREEDDTGLALTALGYWVAFHDLPVNHLWSDVDLSRWRMLNAEGVLTPDTSSFYSLSKNSTDGLVITPKNGEPFTAAKPCHVGYEPPDRTTLPPVFIGYTWSFNAPAAWRFTVVRSDATWANLGIIQGPIVGTGAVVTGVFTNSFTACDRVMVILETTATPTYNADTNPVILKLSAVVVRGSTNAARIDHITRQFRNDVRTLNPAQLSASNALILNGNLNLRGEVYEDANMADILTRLARLGDASGQLWEVGVDADQRVYLRPRSSMARTWYVATAELRYRATIEGLYNNVYATYKSPTGRTLRTDTTSNVQSISRYGLLRRRAVATTTDTLTQAENHRTVALADTANPPVQVDMTIDAIYSADGARHPLWSVQPGDLIVARTEGVSRRVAGTEYDLMTGTLGITWDEPLPSLERLELRESEGY